MVSKIALIIVLALLSVGAENDDEGLLTDAQVLREMKESNYTVIGDMIYPPEGDTRSSWKYYGTWPKSTVPYVISENVTDDLRPVIEDAIKYYHKYTCVKFKHANIKKDKYWVRFLMDPDLIANPDSPTACAAIMGFQEKKDQAVLLGSRCTLVPMLHELEHTLGFNHEHARFDRDKYLSVFFEEMQDGVADQYTREDIDCKSNNMDCGFETWGLPYNYDSIMNYCTMCGSKADKPVMASLKNPDGMGAIDGSNLGQMFGFSKGDWLAINRKHGCDPDTNPQIPQPPPIPPHAEKDNRFPIPTLPPTTLPPPPPPPSKGCKRSKSKV